MRYADFQKLTDSNRGKLSLPLCFIIPEYINRSIMENGTNLQKHKAWQSLILTEQLRGRRTLVGSMYPFFAVADKLHRTVFNANNTERLPGKLVISEGNISRLVEQPTVRQAFQSSGETYNFYRQVFDRNSIDGKGMKLDSTVHYGEDYNNAFWNGTQMVYGDGDGELFNAFTSSLDVVGHELTHGVTQYEAALEYLGQPGALNESFSDIFGILVKQYKLNHTVNKADWLVGEGLFSRKVKGVALRSMKNPGTAYDDPIIGKDPQPGHMNDYVKTLGDGGGVHINSGIPNHAFYLTAMAIGGNAWEKAGKIWYSTLTDRLSETSLFKDASNLTFQVAGDLFGSNSAEQNSVYNGWDGVGLAPHAKS